MPRSKTGRKREHVPQDSLKEALQEVISNNASIRSVAKKWNISKSTLHNYLKKQHNLVTGINEITVLPPNYSVHKIFTNAEEKQLFDYLAKAAVLHFGLTKIRTRKLAFNYATALGKKIPDSWQVKQIAGREWLVQFRRRWQALSLRKPEATSLARATSFNKSNIQKFFNNYTDVMKMYKFGPENIYNLDETSNFTVHKPSKILAPKNIKQLGSLTSAERGTNVTMLACINAVGQSVPPLFVFPRVHYKEHMNNGGPPGCIGAANPSGWSTAKIFLQFLEHIINHTKPTVEKPILIIMDNHDTHISIEIIDKAKDNGVVLLTIHPHTSHKMQPLDRGVFGPYKTFYNKAAEDWMLTNPGKPISIYDVAGIAGKAYLQAFTPKNIVKSFEVTGLWPVNSNIFTEEEYLQSYITDRPEAITPKLVSDSGASTSSEAPKIPISNSLNLVAVDVISTSSRAPNNPILKSLATTPDEFALPSTSLALNISVESVAPFPKAPARKHEQGGGGRKKGKTRILTSTPEKIDILSELLKKTKKTIPKEKDAKTKGKKNLTKLLCISSSEGEDDDNISFCETSDEMDFDDIVEEHNFAEFQPQLDTNAIVGDFLLIKLCSKKQVKHYVAKVLEKISDTNYVVKFYEKTHGQFHFVEGKEEPYEVDLQDVVLKLPLPQSVGASKRLIAHVKFNVSFDNYNMF